MLSSWFSLASILLLLTANASEAPKSSLIVPYRSHTNVAKRSYINDGICLRRSNNNISGFCYESAWSLGYWYSIDDDDYDYGYEGSPYLTHVPEWYKYNDDLEYTVDVAVEYCGKVDSSNVPEETNSLALSTVRGLFLIAGFTSFLSLLLYVVSGIYYSVKKHTFINLKSKLFKKNGGLLLKQYVASHAPASGCTKIFTAEELEMATTSGQGPEASSSSHGPVYHRLSPADMAFVKEKVLVEDGQIERFINEIITLSQLNHQNVIKLLGCCLETEAPILVYEIASNGTLSDYIHENSKAARPHWDILMEIASESAAGLAYLHSQSIVHGSVKSCNILLTDCLAKVAGFGPPRLVPSNESHISTLVNRTLGYLDPEYLVTGQLTHKSDVYSFGVVLVEILTGEKPVAFDRPESRRIITCHFLLSMEQQNGLYDILAPQVKEENKEQVRAVAELAKQCLKLTGAERPTMEQVARQLKSNARRQEVTRELKRLSGTHHLMVHVH